MAGRSSRSHSRYVLIICYDFPDIGSAGIIRTYQLAKELPSFGWQPIILAAQPCSVDQENNIETSDGHLRCLKITVPPSSALVPFHSDRQVQSPLLDGVVPQGNGLLRRMVRFASQLAVPDGKIGWLPAAVRRGVQIARQYPLAMSFSVSPRPTSHLVAQRVAQSLRIPWVADFVLPWSDAYWLSGRPRFIKRLDQRLEESVIRSAQHVMVAYPDIARSIGARFGSAWQKKISVIPTGFNDDLFEQKNVAIPSKFRVLYPGNHFCEEGRYGECFLKAVDEWIGLNSRWKDTVEILFIGKRDDELLRQRDAMVHPEVIRVEPLISHRVCIQAILSSHMCVVNTVGNRIPAKVYECMRAGKWILALTEPVSDLDALMRHYSRGISVPAQDIAAIRNALRHVWQSGDRKGPERIDADPTVEMYSSKHSAEMVSRICDSLSLLPGGEDHRGLER